MRQLKKVFERLDKINEVWCILLISVMTIFVIVSVFLRYIFNIAFMWSEELIIFIFIGTTYFGAIMCSIQGEHIDISYFKEKISEKARIILEIIISLINMTVVICICKYSLIWIDKIGDTLTVGMKIPSAWVYIMMPISFVLIALNEFRRIIRQTTKLPGRNGL